ncbi:MAG: class I poly(R)-hydroxyalkanoic acid synthase [Gammaproteobacteria bacterium]|nr:MAG: class I poly(R)-hydroxyalkanoic acid synthase [Gammaproteobacteria bacterium]
MLQRTIPHLDPGNVAELAETSRQLTELGLKLFAKSMDPGNGAGKVTLDDPLGLAQASLELSQAAWANPGRVAVAQLSLWWDYATLAQHTALRLMGAETDPVIEPAADDRRFRHAGWDENLAFDVIKQAYLLTSRAWVDLVKDFDELDQRTQRKLAFSISQMADALSPSNFALTNPEVLQAIAESGGRNLVDGMKNLMSDLADSDGQLDIKTTDHDAFEVGKNLAVTPGKVVFQNDLIQLIQYAPSTGQVHRTPLLIMPPWMNKYYIMDLRPGNSMVEWLIGQGHTVFMVSWVNPDERFADKGFEEYMLEGPIAALDAIHEATGERQVNVTGYCLGGILLSAAAAWLKAKGDDRIKSASYLTAMVDFCDTGEISLFIDEQSIDTLEQRIKERGFLDGKLVDVTFRTLRANDLVWSFFINSYLLGKSPKPFDILYWNADSTNMPAAMHTFFMRSMYLENRLREPGGITLAGVPIDVTVVDTPSYVFSTKEDHIAPWKTGYVSAKLFAGPVTFVLGASGHIAGVINPPEKQKYGYWSNDELPADADTWLDSAAEHPGSWWPHWMEWLKPYAGEMVPARTPGDGKLAPIEDAPGSYVKVRF